MARESVVRPLVAVRPPVKPIMSETMKRLKNAKFCGKPIIEHILQTNFVFVLKILFIYFYANMGPYGSKTFTRYL